MIWAAKTVEQSAYQATSMRAIRRFTKKCHPPFQDLAVLALKRQNRGMVRRSQNNLKNDTKNYWAPETGVTLAILGAKLYFHPYTSLQFWPQNAHYSTNSTHNRKKSRNRAPRPEKPGKWSKKLMGARNRGNACDSGREVILPSIHFPAVLTPKGPLFDKFDPKST